ncbi:MAG: hypothetical protein COA50_15625 [Flavobacteriaceae bacterium]|nr:MAG: hypothetical protein COA50_15625 [Flavobacteriaceae bacterium]
MKKYSFLLFLLLVCTTHAQTALYNSGNIRIHTNGKIGFHTNLINDAPFDENVGLAGFYGNDLIAISGAFMPIFHDTEIANPNGVFLLTPISVVNNVNFIEGDIQTPRNVKTFYLNFMQDAFYVGESNTSKIDGFVAVTNKQLFSFPVGDEDQLRPLILDSSGTNEIAKCAYFFENPNNPSSLNEEYNTNSKVRDLGRINSEEFWQLESSLPSNITITWNARSALGAFANDVDEITIVGWNISASQWVNIGHSAISGDINQGFAISENFVPSDYAAITFGSITVPKDILKLDNYFMTPNGDGINDILIIEGMELSPNNTLSIYNRSGLKVYEKRNYTNEFSGVSNINNLVINREQGLPNGFYFYVIALEDLELNFQGYLYLSR